MMKTDPKKPLFERIDDDTIVTNGDIEVDIINEVFKTSILQGDDYSTLNGLLHDKLHDLPKEGSVFGDQPIGNKSGKD